MTNKQLVLKKYPNAIAWIPDRFNLSARILAKENDIVKFIGKGKTAALAWKNALDRINET